jgi:ribosomal protein S18 acetylase RimI-like enzyme
MTDPALTIRRATDDDVAALAEVYIDGGRHHAAIDPELHQVPTPDGAAERIRAKLASTGRTIWAAERDGDVVGLLEVIEVEPPTAGAIVRGRPTASVGIAVREGARGAGIGTELMRFAEGLAREMGCTAIILDMSVANEGALRFYERLGYATYGLLLRKRIAPEGSAESD